MNTKVGEFLIWDTEWNGAELVPTAFSAVTEEDPYAETARVAKERKSTHVLTRGPREFLAAFDGRGELCSSYLSPEAFMQHARAFVKGNKGL